MIVRSRPPQAFQGPAGEFAPVVAQAIRSLEAHSTRVHLHKGQSLFVAGDTPRSVYAVAKGCLKIARETPDGDSVITRIVGPGEIIGIREVCASLLYSRSSVALIESEAHAIESAAMLELIEQQPRLGLHFMTVFAEELARTESRIESDLYTPAHTRVAKVIGDLYRLFGSSGQASFRPPLNRRDIAELAGVTPETVSRAIAELRSAGVIETQGATFLVLDPRALVSDGERC